MGQKVKRLVELLKIIEGYLGEDDGVSCALPEEWEELKFLLIERFGESK